MIVCTNWADFVPALDQKKIILSPFCGESACEDKIKADSTRDEPSEAGVSAMGALCIPLERSKDERPAYEDEYPQKMCCRRKKKRAEAAAAAAPVQPPSKKEVPANQHQTNNNKDNSQRNYNNNNNNKEHQVKEGAIASNHLPINEASIKKPNKDGSKKSVRHIEDLDGHFAAPGPAKILPKIDPAELKEAASEVFPVASLKKEGGGVSGDRSAEKMSMENTLKEVPKRMPETDIVHDKDSASQVFTNDQLL